MTEGPGEYSVLEGEDIELICGENLDSDPEATVTWTSPWGEEIKSSGGICNSSNVTLRIENVTSHHNGKWTCTIKIEGSGTTKDCPDPDKSKRTLNIYRYLIVNGRFISIAFVLMFVETIFLVEK